MLSSLPASAEVFEQLPGRMIGPMNDQPVGRSLNGQGGWTMNCSPTSYDEEITSERARSGLHSWRVSNWFHQGCVSPVLSPLHASVAEGASPTNAITASLWFNVPSGGPAGLTVSSSLENGTGLRLTYAGIRDYGGGPTVQVAGVLQGSGYGGPALPPPFDDAGVQWEVHASPALNYDTWYELRVSGVLQIGVRNDQITYEVRDAGGGVVWTSGAISSWEDAYHAGTFAPPGTKVTLQHMSFRIIENPDSPPIGPRTPYGYATARPPGVYIDDISVVPGGAPSQLTVGFESERYVDPAGTDTGNCTTASPASARCQTLGYAAGQATPYSHVYLADGTYDEAITITTDGLRIAGEGPMQPVLTQQSGGPDQPLLVINGAEDVGIDNLAFDMDISHVAEGILASGFVDGLDIRNSRFTVRQSGAGAATYGYRNAITINNTRNSLSLPRVNGSSVTIEDNVIDGINGMDGSFLRAGVNMDAGIGVIADNTIRTFNHDIAVRFTTVTGASSSDSLLVTGNQLNGRGLEIASPNTSTAAITVQANQFDASTYPGPVPNQADFASVRLIRNAAGVPTIFDGNTVAGFGDDFRGMLVENWPGLQLTDNTFTPSVTAGDFVSLVVSNKEVTSDAPPSAPLAMSITATGNNFDAGTPGAGRAVEFLNDNDAGGTATFGALVFGADGDENVFDGDLGRYFSLADHDCDTHIDNSGSGHPQCSFLDYEGTAGGDGSNTEVRPFSGNVTAIENIYDGVEPSAMTLVQQNQTLARTQDDSSNPALGHVDYGFSGVQTMVYVDDDFAGSSYGDALSFSNSVTSNGSVFYGVDAFDSIADAIAAVEEDGTVYIADGTYAEAVIVAKRLSLLGDGSTATTTINGPLSITASGTDAMNPLLFSGLVVSNPGGDGLALGGSVSFLRFEGVAFENNSGHGVNFGGTGNDGIAFVGTDTGAGTADCRFRNNGSMGIRTSSNAIASNISIDTCRFDGNLAGILTFGGSGSGTGQLTGWTVTNSVFTGNDGADATAWGGGIWIKTAGAGSAINGFNVSGSTFADNGSSNALNRVGITLRARPGTTLANVSICNNVFQDTAAGGTQAHGILVFDDTDNSGYQPVSICNNSFDGVSTGVSGTEQRTAHDTQPVVLLSGNTTSGGATERAFVNDPVTNLDTTEVFATIGAALADSNTMANHTIQAGIGSYNEAVSINHDGLTLQGVGADTVIYGAGISASAVTINSHDGVTLQNFHIRDFTTLPSNVACVYAIHSDDITIDGLNIANCQGGRGGIHIAGIGDVDGVTIINNDISNVGPIGARGIVIWDGFKTNITISNNNVHDIAGCCGIELQDGTASGVTVTGNTVTNTADSGMAFTGLMAGAGSNVIAGNTVTDTGRFGIEIKLPNGSGTDSGDGSVVIENNNISLSGSFVAMRPTEERDLAGIAVMRRGFVVGYGNVDIPNGVIVRNNTVSGYVQDNPSSDSEGFGIVLEGTRMLAEGNTVSGNDIGIQRQQGHLPYTANAAVDGNQADLADQYFGRGNSPTTCARLNANNYATNGEDEREVGGAVVVSVVNTDTGLEYCSIQDAVDDPLTLDSHTLVLAAGTFAERVIIDKSLTLQGVGNTDNDTVLRAPDDDGAGGRAVVTVQAPNVHIDNLLVVVDFDDVAQGIRAESSNSPAFDSDGLDVTGVRVRGTRSGDCAFPGNACAFSYGLRNAIQINPHPSATYSPGPVAFAASVTGSVIESDLPEHRFRAGIDARNVGLLARGNDIVSINHDVFVLAQPAGQTVTIGGADINDAAQRNTFRGFGVAYYDPSAAGAAVIQNNRFTAAADLANNTAPIGAGDWSAMRLIHNNVGQTVSVTGNEFSGYERGVLIENFPGVTLSGNSFAPLAGSSTFQHVRLSNKELFSGAAPAPIPGSLTLTADSNTFNGSGGTAVYLLNDNAQLPADADHYGSITFSNSVFDGALGNYFELSPLTCVSTNDAGCPLKPVYDNAIGNNPANGTPVAPFGGDVDATTGNTFGGVAPSAMDYAQYQDTQSRTYHNDPNAPETPTAPASMGIVNYGFASNLIPTTTTVVSTSPNASAIGAPVTVTVNVVNDLNAVPAGSIAVTAADSAGCTIVSYPASNSCIIAGFSAGGVKLVNAAFTPSDTTNQASNGSASHAVTFDPGTTVPIDPAPMPTPTDNDYTRIDNAIQAAGPGVIIELSGEFNWTEPNAYASWELGSDGMPGTDDDWSSKLPAGVGNVTLRASAPGNAGIQGNEGNAPGDFAAFIYSGSMNQGWTFENLTVRGFDVAFAMFGSGAEGLNGTQYLNNRIEIGPDSDDDYANYGIYSGFGEQQTVAGNEILIDISGTDGDPMGDNSRAVAMQIGDSCNVDCFDGLLISSNTITVSGVPGSIPARVIGIWENAVDVNSSIHIEDNSFAGSGDLGDGVENNNQTGIIASTQSNGARLSAVTGNTVSGAAFGLRSQLPAYGHYVGSSDPLTIEGNTFLDNGTALRLHAAYPNAGRYTLRANRIFGNVTGLFAERADDLPLPGAPGYGGDELPSIIDADDNWWGCNAGPSDADCDPVVIESEGVPADDPAQLTLGSWLQLRAAATPVMVVPPAASAIGVDLVSSSDGVTVATAFPDGTGVSLVTSKASFNPPAPFATSSGAVATDLEGLTSGIAVMNATLDNQSIDFYAMVAGPVTVNDNVDGGETLPAGATCAAPDFNSIQAAVDAVPDGTVILVCPGTYIEGDTGAGVNLTIAKPVGLLGAQTGIDARGRTDVGASIIVPAVANPALAYAGNDALSVIDIQTGGVVLDGFVIDGDNPGITTGLPMGSADPDVDSGIWAFGDYIAVTNNVIRNLVYAGFEGYNYDSAHPARQGNLFQQNWVHNLDAPSSWGIGVVLLWNYYADVSDNLFEDVRIGIQTNYFFKEAPFPTEARIADNSIEATRLGIYHNFHTASGGSQSSPFTLSGNSITANANPAGTGPWGGVFIQSLYQASTVVTIGNTVDGSALAGSGRLRVGYFAGLIRSSEASNTAIDGGSVSGVDFGVLATDGAYYAGAVDDMLVRNVAFSDVAIAAIGVEDTDLAGVETVDNSVQLTVGTGNSFAGDVVQHGSLSGPNGHIEYAPGAPLLQRMLVRAAGNGHRDTLPDSSGNVRTVSPGTIDDAIADAAIGGTVTLEAGEFPQNVVVNKSVTVQGPFAGTPGHDAGRDGTGESVLNPATGRALRVLADGVTVDGIAIDDVNDTAISSGQNFGGPSANVLIVNNRVTNVHSGSGLYTNGPAPAVSNWTVQDNLFSNIEDPIGSGVNLWKVNGGLISGNVVEQAAWGGIQTNTGNDVEISGNTIADTGHNGINVAASSNVRVFNNAVSNANTSASAEEAGLTLYGGSSNVAFYCNAVTGGTNAFSTNSGIAAPLSGVSVYHNALQAASSVSHNLDTGAFAVGSNWYGGGSPSVVGIEAGNALVADPLLASPIGSADCGDNTPVELVLYPASGTPQSADLNQPFANPLRVRVQDALGGAVMGDTVSVAAPGSGASALLTPTAANGSLPNLVSDYNGVVEVTAIANGFAGTYDVVADHASNDVAFELTNVALQQVQFDLNGPVAGVEVGDDVAYTGFIGNDNPNVTENVYIHLDVSATVASLDPADIVFCVIDPMPPGNCIPLVWTDNGSTLSLDFTDLSGFPITAPYSFLHNFRAVFGEAGVYSVNAQVIGATSGTVYASDMLSTEVIAQHAGITLDINGPVAGVEKDVPTAYSASLSNEAADVADNVLVEFVLTRIDNGGDIGTGDVLVEYDTGGGVYAPIPLSDDGNQLTGLFGPPGGFALPSGYSATTALRVTYFVAPDTFTVAATVIDAGSDTDGVPTYAADNLSTDVVLADPDVTLDYEGPFATPESAALVGVIVGEPVYFRSRLENHGIDDVADSVYAPFNLTADYSLTASDVSVLWWPASPTCGASTPGSAMPLTLTEDGSGGLDGVVGAPSFTLNGGEVLEVCYEVVFAHVGVYSTAAEIADSGADTDGFTTYAATNLSTVVGAGDATIVLSDLGPITYDGNQHAATATVTATASGDSLTVTVDITYDGNATAPTDAGSYAVVATVNDPDWEGSASGTLVIDPASATVSFSDLSHVYDGSTKAATATIDPVGVTGLSLTYAPVSAPVNVGSYDVAATLSNPNYVLTGTIMATLEITPAASGINVDGTTVTYDGMPHAATVTNPNGEAYTISYVGTDVTYGPTSLPPIHAGSYEATVTVTDPNYSGGPFTAAVIIDPANVDVTLENLSQVYDGNNKPVGVMTTPAGVAVSLSYAGTEADGDPYGPSAIAPSQAGSYSVAVASDDTDYVLGIVTPQNPATLTIAKATAVINFTQLNFVANGGPQAVQYTVSPSGVGIACVETYTPPGDSTIPVDPGSYQVDVACSGPNHEGSASATMNIASAPAATLEIVGASSFTGIAGATLPSPGPTVRVRDGNGDPVEGASIAFSITAGDGSLTGAVVATDVNGEAEVGGWTLDADSSASNGMEAEIVGRADIAAVAFTASGDEQADLSISKTSDTTAMRSGDSVDYLITVDNAGPSNATTADILDALPVELDASSAIWICIGGGGSSCAVMNGSGDVDVEVSIPVGGSVTVLLSATAQFDSATGIDNTAMVDLTSGDDPNSANDLSTWSIGILPPLEPAIFKDGFEGDPAPLSAVTGGTSLLKLGMDGAGLVDGASPATLLGIPGSSGDTKVVVRAFRSGEDYWLRLEGRDAAGKAIRSEWMRTTASDSLMFGWQSKSGATDFVVASETDAVMLGFDRVSPLVVQPEVGITIH